MGLGKKEQKVSGLYNYSGSQKHWSSMGRCYSLYPLLLEFLQNPKTHLTSSAWVPDIKTVRTITFLKADSFNIYLPIYNTRLLMRNFGEAILLLNSYFLKRLSLIIKEIKPNRNRSCLVTCGDQKACVDHLKDFSNRNRKSA